MDSQIDRRTQAAGVERDFDHSEKEYGEECVLPELGSAPSRGRFA